MKSHCRACGYPTDSDNLFRISGTTDSGQPLAALVCDLCRDGYSVTSLPTLAAFLRASAGMGQYEDDSLRNQLRGWSR